MSWATTKVKTTSELTSWMRKARTTTVVTWDSVSVQAQFRDFREERWLRRSLKYSDESWNKMIKRSIRPKIKPLKLSRPKAELGNSGLQRKLTLQEWPHQESSQNQSQTYTFLELALKGIRACSLTQASFKSSIQTTKILGQSELTLRPTSWQMLSRVIKRSFTKSKDK